MQPLRRRRRIVADLPGVAGGGRGAFHPNQRRSSAPVCLRRATSAPAHRKDGGRRTITAATGAAATRPARSPRDAENSGLGRCTGRRRRRRQRRQRGGGGAPLFDCHRARDPSADVAPPPPIGCRSAAAKLHSSPSVLSQIRSPDWPAGGTAWSGRLPGRRTMNRANFYQIFGQRSAIRPLLGGNPNRPSSCRAAAGLRRRLHQPPDTGPRSARHRAAVHQTRDRAPPDHEPQPAELSRVPHRLTRLRARS